MSVISIFQTHCDNLVNTLTIDINNFKNLEDDKQRIKILYDHARSVTLPLSKTSKSYENAIKYKTNGNKYYEKKDLDRAVDSYNSAMVACPHNTDKERELLAVSLANRSAVLLEKELITQCLDDINYLLNLGTYPKHLEHKVLLRKAKCCLILGQYNEGISTIKLAIASLEKANLTPENKKSKLTEINSLLDELKLKSNDANLELVPQLKSNLQTFTPNFKYPAVNDFVDFDEDQTQGRFATAKRDIEPGSIVAEEDPHCLAISITTCTRNCSNCTKSILNPIPCGSCVYTVFCSKNCMKESKCHEIECKITHSLYESGASINCIMALRIITQKPFGDFWNKKDSLGKPISSDRIYHGSDYERLYNLCTHSSMRPKGEFVHYSFMAIYLLRLLKLTNYFPYDTKDDQLTEEECFIGGLILRHLQILQFNAHELSELRNMKVVNENELNYYTCHLGGAVYPTLALFNHSCEPGVIRYNKGKKMVLRAIKLIRAGEVIYDNYGPVYSVEDTNSRINSLIERYWFQCQCVACRNNWPLFNNMSDHELRLICKKCKATNSMSKYADVPMYNCWRCNTSNGIMPVLMKLMNLDRMTQDAEKSFITGNFEKSIVLYCEILKLYYKYLAPPFPDLVKVQQRMRTCMLHDGNKELQYKAPNRLPEQLMIENLL
ncbi:Anaphase-promoting complex subunit 3 protein [Oryctes borbonicus]|uniref:Anaphase-promoting complex subunit 3 protein n=1 Tax=Oryctes borbonicus TaxID=1629725 RepID=A0A0T6AYC9_9SCAR|nr:Anaphase-promoting complex subunit 3 protein [Oryctes borbonicus]